MKLSRILLLTVPILLSGSYLRGQCNELVWADEFDYTGLPDSTRWSYEVGGGGWGNNELEYYTYKRQENARVADGILTIEAHKESYGGMNYTSARLITKQKGDWLYGRIDVKAKLPSGTGTWPAIWMMPTESAYGGWPNSGELDIMEHVGYDPNVVHATVHTSLNYGANGKGSGDTVPDAFTTFHVYALEWTPTQLKFFIDSINYYTYNYVPGYRDWPFDKKFFLIMNIAVGGNWGGSHGIDDNAFPAKMEIDYVRVYQSAENLVIHGPEKASPLQENMHFFLQHDQEASYSWSLKGNGEFLTPADSNEVFIRWGCTADTLMCHLVTSCDTYDLSLPVELTDYSITGPLFIEQFQDPVLMTAPDIQGASYNWTVPAGVTITQGQGDDSLQVAWGGNPGTISLALENTCGTYEANRKVRFYGQYAYPDPDSPHVIPGVINPTEYDYGGEGVAYHDADTANLGDGPREEEGVDTEFGDNGVANVGWIIAGEWLEYSIHVLKDDYYQAAVRIASNVTTRGPLRIYINGEERITDIEVPSTGSWSTFTTIIVNDIPLYTTDTLINFYAVKGGFNLGNITIDTFIIEAIKDNDLKSVLIYPNPFNDKAYIKSALPIKKVILTDLTGKVLQVIIPDKEQDILVVPCNNCHSGLYLLYVITADNFERAVKIIHE